MESTLANQGAGEGDAVKRVWTRLIEARKQKHLTQSGLAGLCKVKQGTVCRWEILYREPDRVTVTALSKILNIPEEVLEQDIRDLFLSEKIQKKIE